VFSPHAERAANRAKPARSRADALMERNP